MATYSCLGTCDLDIAQFHKVLQNRPFSASSRRPPPNREHFGVVSRAFHPLSSRNHLGNGTGPFEPGTRSFAKTTSLLFGILGWQTFDFLLRSGVEYESAMLIPCYFAGISGRPSLAVASRSKMLGQGNCLGNFCHGLASALAFPLQGQIGSFFADLQAVLEGPSRALKNLPVS